MIKTDTVPVLFNQSIKLDIRYHRHALAMRIANGDVPKIEYKYIYPNYLRDEPTQQATILSVVFNDTYSEATVSYELDAEEVIVVDVRVVSDEFVNDNSSFHRYCGIDPSHPELRMFVTFGNAQQGKRISRGNLCTGPTKVSNVGNLPVIRVAKVQAYFGPRDQGTDIKRIMTKEGITAGNLYGFRTDAEHTPAYEQADYRLVAIDDDDVVTLELYVEPPIDLNGVFLVGAYRVEGFLLTPLWFGLEDRATWDDLFAKLAAHEAIDLTPYTVKE